ncbi:MAG TPA: phage tail sheath subtilisin-like domain-containing protein [Blastocatellia bacterium]|nr:phage tail sheath subtilisin-like domain-containing protein [Blastocatellia bacterium]
MPGYQAPEIYVDVEERCNTPSITGVGTSTAAFIGLIDDAAPFQMPSKPGSETDRFQLAAVETPVLITSFEQFKKSFGNFQTGNKVLAHAVFGFFVNGGTRCYVMRVSNLTRIGAALAELERLDEVALVAVPGVRDEATQEALIDHCEMMRNRFAILDAQITTRIEVSSIQGATRNSDYAALYFPQIEVIDQTLVAVEGETSENWRPTPGARTFVPPSGHVAGIYARVDQMRGVHQAPANEIVRGALNLEYPLTVDQQQVLNPEGINVIRGFDGVLKVLGAGTLGADEQSEFKLIRARRLMNFLRESINQGTRFAVYEPSDPALWRKIRREVTAFLTEVWRDGALCGTTPEEAFYVKCDETTNPPAVRKLGLVVAEIGVAVVRPDEFVLLRLSQIKPLNSGCGNVRTGDERRR